MLGSRLLTINDVVSISINDEELFRIKKCATNAELGGKSHIRESDSRISNLSVDQIIGQLGTFALTKHLFGSEESYFSLRAKIDENPFEGDGGSDIDGKNIDVKTSLMRAAKDPLRYRLAVREKERHDDWVYVLSVVDSIDSPVIVSLVGWATDNQLDGKLEKDGIFAGAYTIRAPYLKKISTLKI